MPTIGSPSMIQGAYGILVDADRSHTSLMYDSTGIRAFRSPLFHSWVNTRRCTFMRSVYITEPLLVHDGSMFMYMTTRLYCVGLGFSMVMLGSGYGQDLNTNSIIFFGFAESIPFRRLKVAVGLRTSELGSLKKAYAWVNLIKSSNIRFDRHVKIASRYMVRDYCKSTRRVLGLE